MSASSHHLTLQEFEQSLEEKGLSDTLIVDGTLTLLPEEDYRASPLSHALRRLQTDGKSTSPELVITDTIGEGGMGLVGRVRNPQYKFWLFKKRKRDLLRSLLECTGAKERYAWPEPDRNRLVYSTTQGARTAEK